MSAAIPHIGDGGTGRMLSEGGVLSHVGPLSDPLSLFLVQTIIILTICRLLGVMGSYMKQPKVIFEIIGGIVLGPSAMGRNKAYLTTIFPTSSLPGIGLVANIGLVLYLFIVGMELDPLLLVTHAKRAGGVAMVGMIVPFFLGVAISKTMFDNLQADDPKYAQVRFESFYVFIGTALSITAFPVLARILKESGLIYTVPGAMTMGAAALNDAVAWCLLILAISIANAGDMAVAAEVFLSVVAFSVGLVMIVRPAFFWLTRQVESRHSALLDNYLFALTLALVFLCAWITALLGVHAIFGSFLFGLICMPRDSHLFRECNDCIEELIVTFTLPLYFALSGLKTDVTTISRPQDGAMVVLVCFVASFGKFIGAGGTAYFSGMSVRDSSVVAVLMNTRGLVELIVLNLGMDAGILSIRTFSVMVIMCLFTTFITCPIIELIYPPHTRISEAARTVLNKKEGGGDAVSSKGQRVPDHDDDDDGADEEEGIPSSTEITFNLDEMVKNTNLGVIVDRIEHMEGIMKVMWLYSPFARHSTLEVTAMRFFEPTFTDRDVFVALNEDNKLLEVEEELTSININAAQRARDMAHKATKTNTPDMLPLCMMSKAIGARVDAFRIRGDPINFPGELLKKSIDLEFNVVLLPWRPSPFVEQLFWGSVKLLTVPIALLVQNHVAVPVVPDGQQQQQQQTGDEAAAAAARSRVGSDGSDEASRNNNNNSKSRAGRSASSASTSVLPGMGPAFETPRKESIDSSDGGSSVRPSPLQHLGSIIAGSVNESRPDIADNVQIQSILVLITGAPCDALLLPFVLRASGSQHLTLTLAICADTLSDNLQAAVSSFKHRLRSRGAYSSNVVIDPLPLLAANLAGLMHHVATGPRYDLIALSHSVVAAVSSSSSASASASTGPTGAAASETQPAETAAGSSTSTSSTNASSSSSSSAGADAGSISISSTTGFISSTSRTSTRAPTRRRSLTQTVADVLSPEPDIAEVRRALGVASTSSALKHPELGSLGEMLVAANLSTFVLVYHEPGVKTGRALSVVGAVPFERVAAGAVGLHTIRESDETLGALATEGGSEGSTRSSAGSGSSGSSAFVGSAAGDKAAL